jgi:hypothetical protein
MFCFSQIKQKSTGYEEQNWSTKTKNYSPELNIKRNILRDNYQIIVCSHDVLRVTSSAYGNVIIDVNNSVDFAVTELDDKSVTSKNPEQPSFSIFNFYLN